MSHRMFFHQTLRIKHTFWNLSHQRPEFDINSARANPVDNEPSNINTKYCGNNYCDKTSINEGIIIS